jgi:hypothetical protein
MSKRLQVVFEEEDYEALQSAAVAAGQTVSEWVRAAVRKVRRDQSSRPAEEKLAAIRSAAEHAYPTADIDRMLEEIETGDR